MKGKSMLFGMNSIDRAYYYVYGNYGWLGVLFALLGLAVGVMMTYTIWDRRH